MADADVDDTSATLLLTLLFRFMQPLIGPRQPRLPGPAALFRLRWTSAPHERPTPTRRDDARRAGLSDGENCPTSAIPALQGAR